MDGCGASIEDKGKPGPRTPIVLIPEAPVLQDLTGGEDKGLALLKGSLLRNGKPHPARDLLAKVEDELVFLRVQDLPHRKAFSRHDLRIQAVCQGTCALRFPEDTGNLCGLLMEEISGVLDLAVVDGGEQNVLRPCQPGGIGLYREGAVAPKLSNEAVPLPVHV